MQKTGLIELSDRELDLVAAAGNSCAPAPQPECKPQPSSCSSCGGVSSSTDITVGVSLQNCLTIL